MRKSHFILALLLTCGLLTTSLASEPQAAPSAPQQTRLGAPETEGAADELFGLDFIVWGGIDSVEDSLSVRPGRITLVTGIPLAMHEESFSAMEMQQLAVVLKRIDFSRLAGEYSEPDVSFALRESLTVRGTKDPTKTFRIRSSGSKAPSAYYEVTKYLSTLRAKHFPMAPRPLLTNAIPEEGRCLTHNVDSHGQDRTSTRLLVRGNTILLVRTSGGFRLPTVRKAAFSNAEWTDLKLELMLARFPHIAGSYWDRTMFDGGSSTISTASGPTTNVRETIHEYGNAPAGYGRITNYLSRLRYRKFPESYDADERAYFESNP